MQVGNSTTPRSDSIYESEATAGNNERFQIFVGGCPPEISQGIFVNLLKNNFLSIS